MKNVNAFLVISILLLLALVIFVNRQVGLNFLGLNKITGSGDFLEKNLVEVTIIEPDCIDCGEPTVLLDDLVRAGLNVSKVNFVYQNDSGELVEMYGLKRLPSIIFSKNITNYPFFQAFSFFGTLEDNGFFVFRSSDPPYYSLEDSKVVEGGVTAYLISHSACSECYDPATHLQILATYGVRVVQEFEFDESSELVAKYNITQLPTIVLSPEAGLYAALTRVWSGVGTVESDGFMVFRNLNALGAITYYDLESNSIR